jgi:hypothetical protein
MQARATRNPELEVEWRQHVSQWRASGQSVREFCKKCGLNESRFFAWRRELVRRDAEVAAGNSTITNRENARKPTFVAVHVADASKKRFLPALGDRATRVDASAATIEIVLGGATVRVPTGVDVSTLSQVIHALRRADLE